MVSKMFGLHVGVDKRERRHSGDAEEAEEWLICFEAAAHKSIFRLTACAQMTKEQRVKVTRGALLGRRLSQTISLSLRAEATYSFISDALEMRREHRQWVAGREADSLIKYGLIGKCLSSYSVDL